MKEEKKPSGGGGKKKPAGKGKAAAATASAGAGLKIKIISHVDMVRQGEALLARGLYLSFLAAAALGRYKAPEYALQPAVQRWHLRFGCLAASASHASFLAARAADAAPAGPALLAGAGEAFRAAVGRFDAAVASRGGAASRPAHDTSAGRATAAAAAAALLEWAAAPPEASVVADWSLHPCFPVLRLAQPTKNE